MLQPILSSRLFLCFVCSMTFVASLCGQPGQPQTTEPGPAVSRTIWIPYWSEKDGHHATLHLHNALHQSSLSALVEVLSQQGTVLVTRSFALAKLANLDLPLESQLPSDTPELLRSGSVRISYSHPHEGVLQAELSIRDDSRNHAYTIVGRKSYPGTSRNAYLAIHRPTQETYLELAFANPSPSTAVTVRLSMRRSSSWVKIEDISVNPLNTAKLRVPPETVNEAFSAAAPGTALFWVEYSVTSTEVIANAWLEDEKTGFSNTALFHDEYPQSNSLFATQLILGAFPESILPGGLRFDSSLVFVNVDETPSTLSGSLYCQEEGKISRVALPPQRLEPFTPSLVDLLAIAAGQVDAARGAVCSGEFSYTGAPGRVIGRYYGESISKTYGAYVKLEPFVGRAYNEVYWTVEGDFVPLLTVANFSAERDTIEVYVTEKEKLTRIYSQDVDSFGSLNINIRDVLRPIRAAGTIEREFGGMYVRTVKPTGKLLVKQHAVSAKRMMMSPYYGGYDYIWAHSFNYAPSSLGIGDVSTASVSTCYAMSGCINDEWFIYSSNTSIIDVTNTYGVLAPRPVNALGVGAASLSSTASGPINPEGQFGYFEAGPVQVSVKPKVTIQVQSGFVSMAGNGLVLLGGPGGLVNTAITAVGTPSGGSVLWTAGPRLQIAGVTSANASVSGTSASTSGGDTYVEVNYTVNGQTATASVRFTVLNPTTFSTSVLGGPGSTTPYSSGGNAGYITTVTYRVYDQMLPPNPIALPGIPFTEVLTTTSNPYGASFIPADGSPLTATSSGDGSMFDLLYAYTFGGLPSGFSASRSQTFTVNGFSFIPVQQQSYTQTYATISTATLHR